MNKNMENIPRIHDECEQISVASNNNSSGIYDNESITSNCSTPARYHVKIQGSSDIQLGDKIIYNIDKVHVTPEERAKRKKKFCCFWMFFVVVGSGGATSVAVTVMNAEVDPNFNSSLTAVVPSTSTIMTTTESQVLFQFVNRHDWNAIPPKTLQEPLILPAKRIILASTGGPFCDNLVSISKFWSHETKLIFL